jgi:hypothetical protein
MSNPNKITASYGDLSEFPKMVFGVMGSAGGEVPESAREKSTSSAQKWASAVTRWSPELPRVCRTIRFLVRSPGADS